MFCLFYYSYFFHKKLPIELPYNYESLKDQLMENSLYENLMKSTTNIDDNNSNNELHQFIE
ncbi:hypothetical protein DERP_014117 [Dermatophagoides pteronyssinus]|uniref:Uncharacterized protein n=1 Tax=Dermatophagoides pteronyssinus TaxID=6956 RepID=A0ABQ8IX97_DERPT|nr:hypothetical protein DERP_014117 [Dermatophagoides pteronyssinus]